MVGIFKIIINSVLILLISASSAAFAGLPINSFPNLFFVNNFTVHENKKGDSWRKRLTDRWKKITEKRHKSFDTLLSEPDESKPRVESKGNENPNFIAPMATKNLIPIRIWTTPNPLLLMPKLKSIRLPQMNKWIITTKERKMFARIHLIPPSIHLQLNLLSGRGKT